MVQGTLPCTHLRSDRRAPRRAREFVTAVLADAPEELRARACQVVTELVTNSVHHAGRGEIAVEANVTDTGGVDIDVRDEGPGFELPPRAPGQTDPDGWGLLFVDMLAESWACGGPGAPVVWAHFEPRTLEDEPSADPLVESRLRDLLDVRMLLDSIKDYAIFGLDRDGRITLWNAGGERLTGYATNDILGAPVTKLHHDPAVIDELPQALAAGRLEYERWMYRKDGSRFWADSVITPILDSSASVRGFSVIVRDATWRKQLDQRRDELMAQIRHLARSDDLTGLPNRRRFHEELDRELARSRRSETPLCVAMVDLDGFKGYNDRLGHLAGDDLLASTANAWSGAVRETDMLARYGGDEFAVILPECPLDEAGAVLERLRAATPEPVTCSAGIACAGSGDSAETLIRRADVALYRAKRSGRDTAVADMSRS